jgi:hypothetical protein
MVTWITDRFDFFFFPDSLLLNELGVLRHDFSNERDYDRLVHR